MSTRINKTVKPNNVNTHNKDTYGLPNHDINTHNLVTHDVISHDIVVTGGGMVGLSLAVACAQQGLKVAVIEKHPPEEIASEHNNYSPRVSAINHASERFLQNIGAWQHIPSNRRQPYQAMDVWDGLGTGKIQFDAQTVQKAHIGHIIENSFIVESLWQQAYSISNLDIFLGHSIETWSQNSESVSIELSNKETLTATVLVSCEGKNSRVREQSNIEKSQWDYNHTAIVTTVKHSRSHAKIARQTFLETGPLAFLPLPHEDGKEQYSSIVWSVKSEQTDKILSYNDQEFKSAINQVFEQQLGEILEVTPRFSFPLIAHQAHSYFDKRVVILGDAAHSIHPLAGLGVNLGFLDAATLAQEFIDAKKNNVALSHPHTLRKFQRQRQSHNLAVSALMETLKRLYDTQSSIPVLVRNAGMNLLNSNLLVKRPLILGALGDFGTPLPPLCK